MTRLKDGPGEDNNPIVQYQRWAEHRYDPGRWLGGNVPPDTRGFYSGMNRRWLGAVYIAAVLISVILSVHYATDREATVLVLMMLALVYGVPGLIMLFARDRIRPRRKHHREHD